MPDIHRMSANLLALAVAATMTTAQAGAEIRVIGNDDRQSIEATEPPFVSIGRVNRSGRAFCTGILIAPDRVLTAAHCLYDRGQDRWAPVSAVHFVVGYTRGDYVDHAAAASYAVAEGYDRAVGEEMEGMLRDWAVITLEHTLSVPPTPIWSMAFESAAVAMDGGSMLQAGYSADRPHILSVHEGCDLVGVTGGVPLLLHECDAIEGDSGSPLILRRGDRYGIIGLHIARVVSEGIEYGVAIPSDAFAGAIGAWLGPGVVEEPPADQ